ncbi:excinuclease ABC subunit UvrA [Streptomyces alfalfae]|uniref:UvrABC system protein A n=1 Tax=Streptomyces alfalfae TaxID=1642299 RepID=A0ABM6GNA7_9ACTN|nr:excinuclease ABC subunit UvrA [Streptomyces alfalfae]APY85226.1 daunorubicin resistance protein DrrC [Streptomyces alfalfae]AYA15571.1 excinuclease ABC subunit UvrA [Streptomyces fradiae]RXX39047.1 excinuclease ABC subunit UvrA [Streptomyces alfalfae]RZM90823.1 excinuclease ABC subunit UvrA [Streptomyces alfalfae]
MRHDKRHDTHQHIVIAGARENNLKEVDLRIPKGRLTVFTGVSGSGKSSVVFDTIAVESRRQLNETFTWFVRNRLPKYERPHADVIEDLSPAIVVDQRPVGGHSRSTVGTMTDVYSVIRVLFSRHGTPSAGPATAYSFNDPSGMCPECDGLGRTVRPDYDRILDPARSLADGAILFPPFAAGTWQGQTYTNTTGLDTHKPVGEFTESERRFLLRGGRSGAKVTVDNTGGSRDIDYEGLADRFERLYLNRDLSTLSQRTRDLVRGFLDEGPCPSCHGARLNPAALATRVNGLGIADCTRMEVTDLIRELGRVDDPVAGPIARAAVTALERIEAIGLGYLSLDRETSTLSGGEGQRLKTVRHLGSSLTGMTYIFDEPSVGLHPRDVGRLNDLLLRLRDKGNTVLVVEHDPDVIAVADHVVDMGPAAGGDGGRVVFEGTPDELRRADTLTGRALRRTTGVKEHPREPSGGHWIKDADLHNLKNVSVCVPTGVLTAVTGVAGSGKSTLVKVFTEAHPDAVVVDQSSIGVSGRSTPATYLGVMDTVRRIFARETGTDAGLFSFNSQGACEHCQGRGVIHNDLAFMDPVTTTCEACEGRRFKDEVLRLTVRGRSVVDVLAMTADEALQFFASFDDPAVRRRLNALRDVGLGHLTLGRPLSTLSGGERQRIKLATQLHRTGTTYVLDEPTTGLHMADVDGLLALLDRLVDAGNTVVVVEHNLDVVKHADRVIDLGPEGGKHGGRVVFEGTPARLAAVGESFTADHLRRALGRGRARAA